MNNFGRTYNEAVEKTGGHQTPHILEKAFSWHTNLAKNGTMLESALQEQK